MIGKQKKILLGQLGRRGDCLYATAIARQIKVDFPNSHVTWAISSLYRSVIEGNPCIDEIWEVHPPQDGDMSKEWDLFEREAIKRKNEGVFDEIFLTQILPTNIHNYDGTIRSSLFRNYPYPITVPIDPTIMLSVSEIEHVNEFVRTHNISPGDTVILFECASLSNQSFVTPKYALSVARKVLKINPNIKFVLTSNKKIESPNHNIIDGSILTFRENAELIKYCRLFVGCSSGVSWLATSDWAKPIPKIQVLSKSTRMYASMYYDAKYFGLSTDNILELYNTSENRLAEILVFIISHDFAGAHKIYQQELSIEYDFYFKQLYDVLLSKGEFSKTAYALQSAFARYKGDIKAMTELRNTLKNIFFPYLRLCWDKISDHDRNEISILLGYTSEHANGTASIARLCYESVRSRNSKIARIFLLDVLRRHLPFYNIRYHANNAY